MIKDHYDGSGSRIRVKDQNQEWIRIKDRIQESRSKIRSNVEDQRSEYINCCSPTQKDSSTPQKNLKNLKMWHIKNKYLNLLKVFRCYSSDALLSSPKADAHEIGCSAQSLSAALLTLWSRAKKWYFEVIYKNHKQLAFAQL